jgi:HPt (histidine-containing phosphotransfer) domain-containing protein
VFDFEASLQRLAGDLELFHKLVEFFREDAPLLLGQAEAALAAGDAREVERCAHSLKGLAANFTASTVIAAAVAVEEPARAGDLQACRERLPALIQQVNLLEQALPRPVPDSTASTAAEEPELRAEPAGSEGAGGAAPCPDPEGCRASPDV